MVQAGVTVTWSLVSEVWGALRQTSGSERLDAGGLKQRNTHEIWIRWRSDVTSDMRFVLDTARLQYSRCCRDVGARTISEVPGRGACPMKIRTRVDGVGRSSHSSLLMRIAARIEEAHARPGRRVFSALRLARSNGEGGPHPVRSRRPPDVV